ncbi:MAG TPA: sigma-70 family RNA polymerase sigma factor [Acidimicrobiales bacterium]|nr:sigma-70 family RNA polymerase sigma factor [Acidimicrobiales bacterium]
MSVPSAAAFGQGVSGSTGSLAPDRGFSSSQGLGSEGAGQPPKRTARDNEARHEVAILVEQATAGSQDAWNGLVDRFASTVWAIARGHRLNSSDAADVFQTTWLRLVEHLHKIDYPERVGAWLATTARHESLRVLRMGGRQVPNGADFDAYPDDRTAREPDADLISTEQSELINQLVDLLPVRSQTLLRLLSADSPLSYKDISEALSMPIGSIGPTRARALDQLRKLALASGINLQDVFAI